MVGEIEVMARMWVMSEGSEMWKGCDSYRWKKWCSHGVVDLLMSMWRVLIGAVRVSA